jgi:hypothetical protein
MTLCILIHGTFARNAPWTREGSEFRRALANHFAGDPESLRFETLQWSGRNTRSSRIAAAGELSKLVARFYTTNADEDIVLIGHSHGGGIIA